MKPRPSPTSPAAKSAQSEVADIWKQGNLQQPLRTPWGRVMLLVIVIAVLMQALLLYGLSWSARHYPNSWVARFVPSTATTTTVIQTAKDTASATVPTAVQSFQASAYAVARNQGEQGIYAGQDATGVAWPLSGSGWLVSLSGAWPTDVKSLVLLPIVGQPLTVTTTLPDSASPFIFLKTTDVTSKPITLAPTDSVQAGERVWIATADGLAARQLLRFSQPKWVSTDVFEGTWSIDAPVSLPIGSAVVDSDGRVVGLLGSENRVWPVRAIESQVKQVVQSGTLLRPVLGLHALDQNNAAITGQPNATGWLVGADDGQVAVTSKGPSDKAGIHPGDVVTELNHQPISGSLQSLVQSFEPGNTINITLLRDAKTINLDVKLGSSRP